MKLIEGKNYKVDLYDSVAEADKLLKVLEETEKTDG